MLQPGVVLNSLHFYFSAACPGKCNPIASGPLLHTVSDPFVCVISLNKYSAAEHRLCKKNQNNGGLSHNHTCFITDFN